MASESIVSSPGIQVRSPASQKGQACSQPLSGTPCVPVRTRMALSTLMSALARKCARPLHACQHGVMLSLRLSLQRCKGAVVLMRCLGGCPADTPLAERVTKNPEMLEAVHNRTPMRRIAQPSEVSGERPGQPARGICLLLALSPLCLHTYRCHNIVTVSTCLTASRGAAFDVR